MALRNFILHVFLTLHISALLAQAEPQLQMIHVLSANKFYVPNYNESESYFFERPDVEYIHYKYFVLYAVNMPNSVKYSLYALGENLRKTYDSFLGPYYTDEAVKTRTTQFAVSQMAGQLINAGLWRPRGVQIWNPELMWQPIPFDYEPWAMDYALLGTLCPAFEKATERVEYNNSGIQIDTRANIELYQNVSLYTAFQFNMFKFALDNSIALGQNHSKTVLDNQYIRDQMKVASLKSYDLLSNLTLQRQLNGGPLLKQIIADSKEFMQANRTDAIKNRKVNLYSGDDRNLFGILKILNQTITTDDLPEAGAALVFELFTDNDEYYIRGRYYRSGHESRPMDLKISNDTAWPFDKFVESVKNDLPEDENKLCFGDGGSAVARISIAGLMLVLYTFTANTLDFM